MIVKGITCFDGMMAIQFNINLGVMLEDKWCPANCQEHLSLGMFIF